MAGLLASRHVALSELKTTRNSTHKPQKSPNRIHNRIRYLIQIIIITILAPMLNTVLVLCRCVVPHLCQTPSTLMCVLCNCCAKTIYERCLVSKYTIQSYTNREHQTKHTNTAQTTSPRLLLAKQLPTF